MNTAGCDKCSEILGGHQPQMQLEVLSSAGEEDGQCVGVRRAETWGGGGGAEATAREPCGTWRGRAGGGQTPNHDARKETAHAQPVSMPAESLTRQNLPFRFVTRGLPIPFPSGSVW